MYRMVIQGGEGGTSSLKALRAGFTVVNSALQKKNSGFWWAEA